MAPQPPASPTLPAAHDPQLPPVHLPQTHQLQIDQPDHARAAPAPLPQQATIAALPAVLHQNIAKAAASPVELLLNPEELGRMRFEMQQNGDHLRIILTVERPETQDLLRRHADQLLAEVKGAGFAGASLSFGQWGQGQSSAKPQPAPDPQPQPQDLAPPAAPLRPAMAPSGHAQGQSLNLRL